MGSGAQSGFAVALEVILDSRNEGFESLHGVVDEWDGDGVFASATPVEVGATFRQNVYALLEFKLALCCRK